MIDSLIPFLSTTVGSYLVGLVLRRVVPLLLTKFLGAKASSKLSPAAVEFIEKLAAKSKEPEPPEPVIPSAPKKAAVEPPDTP